MEGMMRIEGVPGAEIMMLPLGYSLGQICHAVYALVVFMRTYQMPARELLHTGVRSLIATFGGGFTAYIVLNIIVSGVRTETFTGIFLQGALAGVAGVSTVVLLLYLMRSPELIELWTTLRRRSFFVRILGPDKVDTLAL
jgi:hypothetical protein